jgi:hypothetical protein
MDRQQTLAAGFDEHLVKSVETQTLLRLLGEDSAVTPTM